MVIYCSNFGATLKRWKKKTNANRLCFYKVHSLQFETYLWHWILCIVTQRGRTIIIAYTQNFIFFKRRKQKLRANWAWCGNVLKIHYNSCWSNPYPHKTNKFRDKIPTAFENSEEHNCWVFNLHLGFPVNNSAGKFILNWEKKMDHWKVLSLH